MPLPLDLVSNWHSSVAGESVCWWTDPLPDIPTSDWSAGRWLGSTSNLIGPSLPWTHFLLWCNVHLAGVGFQDDTPLHAPQPQLFGQAIQLWGYHSPSFVDVCQCWHTVYLQLDGEVAYCCQVCCQKLQEVWVQSWWWGWSCEWSGSFHCPKRNGLSTQVYYRSLPAILLGH